MGGSKSWREGPAYQGRNTPGGDTTPSKGPVVKAEGTHQSDSEGGRKGMRSDARSKSRSGSMPAKNSGPHGES